MDKRTEIVAKMISAAVHTRYQDSKAFNVQEIMNMAVDIRKALNKLYSLTDKQWSEVLADIGQYAECLI